LDNVVFDDNVAAGVLSIRPALPSGVRNSRRVRPSAKRIRRDRVLHEALTARADPLHLALVFGISQTAASKYTLAARDILAGQPHQDPGERE
jgi:hypothetical protein